MSSPDVSQTPIITTAPDDVFYILKSVISRTLSTGSVLLARRMLEQLREVVEKDYIGIIKKKLDDVYRTSNPNTRADKIERENRMSFIVRIIDPVSGEILWFMHTADLVKRPRYLGLPSRASYARSRRGIVDIPKLHSRRRGRG